MDVTDASLRDRYSKMGTEELIDLVRNSDLTDSASKILNQTLSERGVTEEDQTRRVKEASMEEKKLRSKIGFQWWVVWAWLGII